MHSKSHKIKFMIYDNADEVIEEHFELLFNRYRIGLETSIGVSDLVLDCVHLLYQKYRKINLNQGGSVILSWIVFIYCIKNIEK